MDIKKEVERVMRENELFHYGGIGLYNDDRKLSLQERSNKLEELRQQVFRNLDQIEFVVNWLKDVEKIKSANRNISSYGLKHLAENCFSPDHYISNGCFIIGAVIAGFKVMDIVGVNCHFNMSQRSLNLKKEQ